METGYGLFATDECCGLGRRVREIQVVSRVQAAQPAYDTVGIQVDILHGMGTSAVGPGCRDVLCSTHDLLHCTTKGIGEDGLQNPWYLELNRISRCARLVDGEVRTEG